MEYRLKRTIYSKVGNRWIYSCEWYDPLHIYSNLACELESKKLRCCTWIKSIKFMTFFNGWHKITVYYDNNTKCEYILPDNIYDL